MIRRPAMVQSKKIPQSDELDMKKHDVEVFRQAVALAATGDHPDWKSVQAKLVEKGFRRAPDLLDGHKIRAIIDAQCNIGRAPGKGDKKTDKKH